MTKVMLDTNFLLTMVRYKIHALEEIKEKAPTEFFTLSGVIDELAYLAKDKKIKKELAIIKQIIKNQNIKIIKSKDENVDKEMIELCKEYVIATNDKELRKKIKTNGGKVIYIKKLTFVDTSEILE